MYQFKCKSCPFTYIGETKRSWNSRWLEHEPGVRKRKESTIKDHAEKTGHDLTSIDVEILERGVRNYHKRIFLEALHSVLNGDSVNERAELPRPYLPLLRSLWTHRDQLNSPTLLAEIVNNSDEGRNYHPKIQSFSLFKVLITF